jgi:hypothetical protein
MTEATRLILNEIPDVQKIVRAACVIESIERGVPTEPGDPLVQRRAAELILLVGEDLRASHLAD